MFDPLSDHRRIKDDKEYLRFFASQHHLELKIKDNRYQSENPW